MRQVYNLNLEAVLSVLLRRQLSGTLTAMLPKGKVLKEPSHIEMLIDRGKLQSCELRSDQRTLRGEEALRVIAQLGLIPWIFEPARANTSRLLPHSGPLTTHPLMATDMQRYAPLQNPFHTRIPRKVGQLSPADLARLPRPYFQVYANIDGRHTLAEIAALLRTTPERIEGIVRDLQTWQLIVFD